MSAFCNKLAKYNVSLRAYQDSFPHQENGNNEEEHVVDRDDDSMDYTSSDALEVTSPRRLAVIPSTSTTATNSGFLTPQLPRNTRIFQRHNSMVPPPIRKNRIEPIIQSATASKSPPKSPFKSPFKSPHRDLLQSQEYPY